MMPSAVSCRNRRLSRLIACRSYGGTERAATNRNTTRELLAVPAALLVARSRQLHISRLPRGREPLLDCGGIGGLALCTQRRGQTIQRPAVFREVLEIVAVDLLRFGRTAGLE